MFVSTTLAKSVKLRIIPVVANQHLDAKMAHHALNVFLTVIAQLERHVLIIYVNRKNEQDRL